jgi:hypothetical protein
MGLHTRHDTRKRTLASPRPSRADPQSSGVSEGLPAFGSSFMVLPADMKVLPRLRPLCVHVESWAAEHLRRARLVQQVERVVWPRLRLFLHDHCYGRAASCSPVRGGNVDAEVALLCGMAVERVRCGLSRR